MVHHFCFMRPVRTLLGLVLLAGATLCFYRAVESPQREGAKWSWEWHGSKRELTAPSTARQVVARMVPINENAPPPNPPRPMLAEGVRPDWVGKPPHLESRDGIEVYVATATAGPYSTPEECDRAIGAEIDRVVADFAEKQFQPIPEQPIKLDRSDVQEYLIRGRYRETVNSNSFGPMQQEHVLLVFESQARAAIERAWRSAMVNQRLKFAAAGSGALLLVLGGVYSLLKWKPAAPRS